VAVRPGDPGWPAALATVSSPPKVLYARGDLGVLARPCVAIVGSRNATPYGLRVARALGESLASAGACVVSGLALGVDGAAHRGALEAGGATAAVLAGGIDDVYPGSHRGLHADIVENGVVLAEYPGYVRKFAGMFPRRNRIVAALSTLTIVVEAGVKSGALITANHALEYGRRVAAVPGEIDSPLSEGTNALIRDGADVIANVSDALALAGVTPGAPTRVLSFPVGSDEATLWDLIPSDGIHTDEIVARTGWPPSRCLVSISVLEMQGLLECGVSGEVRRR
jgi:DNA processing protein